MWRAVILTIAIALIPGLLILLLNPKGEGAGFVLRGGDQRVCNTVLNPPDGAEIIGVAHYQSTGSPHLIKGLSIETIPLYEDNRLALLDPVSGEVLKITAGPEDTALLDAVLATKRVTPINSLTATWPYSERTLLPAARDSFGVIHYRSPDPGAGLALIVGFADGHVPYSDFMVLTNCRSEMAIFTATTEAGTVVPEILDSWSHIHHEDRQAFTRFLAEVAIEVSPTE
jgi:hypothetical protein